MKQKKAPNPVQEKQRSGNKVMNFKRTILRPGGNGHCGNRRRISCLFRAPHTNGFRLRASIHMGSQEHWTGSRAEHLLSPTPGIAHPGMMMIGGSVPE